jgi:DNA-directed RNA polymerase subunit M/transcription elongation factor TFIIS
MIIYGAMSNYGPFLEVSETEQNKLIKKIETSCLNATIKKTKEDNIQCSWQTPTFVNRYHNMIHEKSKELDFTENTYLIPKILSGEIDPTTVGQLTSEEANPTQYAAIREKIDARKAQKIQKKIVTEYKCPECGACEATIQNLQLRGLDEAKSTVVTCENCEHPWTSQR